MIHKIIYCKTLFVIFLCYSFHHFRDIKYAKKYNKTMKNRKKKKTPCLQWNPARGNKSQSLPKFLDCRLIFFISDGQFFWPVPLNPAKKKINPEVHFLKFASFLSPIVSHLDSRHLSFPYGPPYGGTPGPPLPTHSLCPPCSIPAGHKNSAAFQLPRDHAWLTYPPLSQSMLGNSVLNSK